MNEWVNYWNFCEKFLGFPLLLNQRWQFQERSICLWMRRMTLSLSLREFVFSNKWNQFLPMSQLFWLGCEFEESESFSFSFPEWIDRLTWIIDGNCTVEKKFEKKNILKNESQHGFVHKIPSSGCWEDVTLCSGFFNTTMTKIRKRDANNK